MAIVKSNPKAASLAVSRANVNGLEPAKGTIIYAELVFIVTYEERARIGCLSAILDTQMLDLGQTKTRTSTQRLACARPPSVFVRGASQVHVRIVDNVDDPTAVRLSGSKNASDLIGMS